MKSPKAARETVLHELPPVWSADSRTLVLGSIPSPKSRETGFYYGHPQNRFWRTLARVFGEPVPETVPEKKAMLGRHKVALWDVLASCTIVGAGDASIEDPVPNDVAGLVAKTKVTRIFCTGATAHRLYVRHCAKAVGIEAVRLPSTSPANCAVSDEALVAAYRAIAEE